MPDQVYHGYFDNTGHDIAVTNVTASPDKVDPGEPISINVTVTNQGNYTETFNVTVYADMDTTVIGDEITVGTQTNINLTAVNSTPLKFNWNTTGVRSGLYNIMASASVLLGEKNTTNNVGWRDRAVVIRGPPVARFDSSPEEPVVDEIVIFDASDSYDPDTYPEVGIANYTWDFGDGNITFVDYPIISHVYATAGNYIVNLSVTDFDDKKDTGTKSITVGKSSSNITISAALATVPLDESATISGSITPARGGAIVTIWYRLSGQTWNTVNVTTNEASQYSHTWTPTTDGIHKLKASWAGDVNTFPAESATITVEVIKIHDIAVTSAVASPDTVKIGEPISINVTITNQGHYTETFNVTVYANTTIIGTLMDVILTSRSSTTLPITWDTTDITKGNYLIRTNVSLVEGETDTDDNTYTDGIVTVQETSPSNIPWQLYMVALGAAIIIATIAFYFLRIRKPKPA